MELGNTCRNMKKRKTTGEYQLAFYWTFETHLVSNILLRFMKTLLESRKFSENWKVKNVIKCEKYCPINNLRCEKIIEKIVRNQLE